MTQNKAIVGVSDHNGWAVLVTARPDGTLIDRRRIELLDEGLPCMPYHHTAQGLRNDEAIALVERVRVSAEKHAKLGLDTLADEVSASVGGIALRECPPLPPTIPARIADYRAQCVADTVMYRQALVVAAEAHGWDVHWYRTKNVLDAAGRALAVADLDAWFGELRQEIGPPWRKDHMFAMAAAIAAGNG
jgi:hypothetical protein